MTWELPVAPGIYPTSCWMKGAKAMAAFQAEHYATGQSGKNQHHGSKAMTLVDVTRVCQNGAKFGLSHCFTFRAVNQSYAVAPAKTYYHKYMLSGLYGLANDDDDDGEAAVRTAPAQVQTPVKPLPVPVVPTPKADNGLNAEQKANALRILKQEDGKAKAAFLAKFYPSKSKLIASDINTLEHAVFLDDFELNARLVH